MQPIALYLPQKLRATIDLPASKSLSNRALVIAALCGGARLENLAVCDDTDVLIAALRDRPERIDIGAAGTAMRFGTAFFATQPGTRVLTGSERMRRRPIAILVDALRRLGASIAYEGEEGFPPLRVEGRTLRGGSIELSAGTSSQYISALLMVAPVMEEGLRLRLTGTVVSRPYIDMTLALMRRFGADADWEDGRTLRVAPGGYHDSGQAYAVEADWSAASYWYEMVALSPDPDACVRLPRLERDSLQGDSRVSDFFRPLGVATTFGDGCAVLRKAVPTPGSGGIFRIDLTRQPDLAQTLAATCAALHRPFHFTGLQSLKIKETDRIRALRHELAKLGCDVGEANDAELFFTPDTARPSAAPAAISPIDTYDDHRMAMAFAPLALLHPGLVINHPEVVSKSYPDFWRHLQAAGAQLKEME